MCGACSMPFVRTTPGLIVWNTQSPAGPVGRRPKPLNAGASTAGIGIPSIRVRLIQLDHGVGHRLAGAVEDPHAQLQVIAGRIGRRHLAEARVGGQAEVKERTDGLR